MSLTLKQRVEALNSNQIGFVNSKDKRVICNKNFGVIIYADEVEALSVHNAIEALSESDFNDLDDSLSSSIKLNERPC